MSLAALKNAIVSRWDAAGLDTSVGELYYGEDQGSPEEQSLPRAQFSLLDDLEEVESRGATVRVQPVQFETIRSTSDSGASDLDLIQAAFKNSHAAATNPLTVTSATVNHVMRLSGTVIQEDDTIYRAVGRYSIKWTECNITPS